ncbi:MAG: S9 family peptidase [Candidatus Cloacimonetes bacterium]|nr:S9 family peptidase [Candidatus Cloacimonadota bacterium]
MKKFFLIGIILFVLACATTQLPAPQHIPQAPVPQKIPYETAIHDTILIDDYYWMKDKSRTDPEVIAHIERENAYADSILSHTLELQDQLYEEILGRIKETDMTVPVLVDSFFYYWKSFDDQEYSIYYRKKNVPDAVEESILDINELASGYDYLEVSDIAISPDHMYLAYAIDTTGAEEFTMFVKDLSKGVLLSDKLHSANSIVWANDNKVIFYAKENAFGRSDKIYRHVLGADQNDDELIYSEQDNAFYVWIYKSKNREYLILTSGSETTYEVRFLSADDPYGEFTLVQPREKGHRYYICPHDDEFYVVSNDNAHNYHVMIAPIDNPGKEHWKEFIPHRDSVAIDIEIFKDHMVVYEQEDALEKIKIIDLKTGEGHYLEFPEPIYTAYPAGNPNYDTTTFRFTYESMVTPYTIYDYDMITREKKIMKQQEIPSGYDPSEYRSERVFASAPDGTAIPISLVYKRDLCMKDGSNPLLLYAYGSYGDSMDPYFSTGRLSLLNRGFIYAIAHVRGGGEYGKRWYEQGRVLNKRNTFTDFIACEEFLIDQKYTSSDKLVIEGASAGGLLIGAVLNTRPELSEIAIANVPFVDVIYTSLDKTLSAVEWHYDEFGNPLIKEEFDYMMSYCPYQNVKEQQYPNILVLGGFYDPRVNYWEPAKWVAKIRDKKLDDNVVLLVTEFSGHGGASGRFEYLRQVALKYAFIFDILGITF